MSMLHSLMIYNGLNGINIQQIFQTLNGPRDASVLPSVLVLLHSNGREPANVLQGHAELGCFLCIPWKPMRNLQCSHYLH